MLNSKRLPPTQIVSLGKVDLYAPIQSPGSGLAPLKVACPYIRPEEGDALKTNCEKQNDPNKHKDMIVFLYFIETPIYFNNNSFCLYVFDF